VQLNRFFRSVLVGAAVFAALPLLSLAVQPSGPSQAAQQAGEPYLRAIEAAAEAYATRDFSKALDKLDIADKIQPEIPDTWNLRGAIYAEQHAFEKAQDAFEKAAKLNPDDFYAEEVRRGGGGIWKAERQSAAAGVGAIQDRFRGRFGRPDRCGKEGARHDEIPE
jgi:tetratricopeptide (TPR) repeat protein